MFVKSLALVLEVIVCKVSTSNHNPNVGGGHMKHFLTFLNIDSQDEFIKNKVETSIVDQFHLTAHWSTCSA